MSTCHHRMDSPAEQKHSILWPVFAETPDGSTVIPLSLLGSRSSTLLEALNSLFAPILLDGEGSETHEQFSRSFRTFLLIGFSHDARNQSHLEKVSRHISFPALLDLT
jgi:hypothetical protein